MQNECKTPVRFRGITNAAKLGLPQEGLTNARKHAPGAAVTLTVHAPDGDLQVEIRSLAPVAVASG